MEQKPLIETNPYLRDPEKFRKAQITSIASSTAIETGASVASIARMYDLPQLLHHGSQMVWHPGQRGLEY